MGLQTNKQERLLQLFDAGIVRVTAEGIVEQRVIPSREWEERTPHSNGTALFLIFSFPNERVRVTVATLVFLWSTRKTIDPSMRILYHDGDYRNVALSNLHVANVPQLSETTDRKYRATKRKYRPRVVHADVRAEIKEWYMRGGYTYKQLGQAFDLDPQTIKRVIHNETYQNF